MHVEVLVNNPTEIYACMIYPRFLHPCKRGCAGLPYRHKLVRDEQNRVRWYGCNRRGDRYRAVYGHCCCRVSTAVPAQRSKKRKARGSAPISVFGPLYSFLMRSLLVIIHCCRQQVTGSNQEVVDGADIVFVCVLPAQLEDVLSELVSDVDTPWRFLPVTCRAFRFSDRARFWFRWCPLPP